MTHLELETMNAIIRIADSLEKIQASLAALVKQNEQALARETRRQQP